MKQLDREFCTFLYEGTSFLAAVEVGTGGILATAQAQMTEDAFCELEAAVNYAIAQAGEAGFIAGVKFQRDPAQFILVEKQREF
jgi:hypothetical protein